MKTLLSTLVLLLAFNFSNAQFSKNIKTYEMESGVVIKEGTKIKISETNNKLNFVFYGKKSMPFPKEFFNKSNSGKVFTVDKVIKLKGVSDDNASVMIVFTDGKNKCYSHLLMALNSNEISII